MSVRATGRRRTRPNRDADLRVFRELPDVALMVLRTMATSVQVRRSNPGGGTSQTSQKGASSAHAKLRAPSERDRRSDAAPGAADRSAKPSTSFSRSQDETRSLPLRDSLHHPHRFESLQDGHNCIARLGLDCHSRHPLVSLGPTHPFQQR